MEIKETSFNKIGTFKLSDTNEMRPKLTPVAKIAPEVKQKEPVNDSNLEISRACAVMGCEESKNLESCLFFKFPEDPDLRKIWTNLTGRNNWMPTDFSYMCVVHFSVDSFVCDSNNQMVLTSKAIPSLRLPGHVLEIEYIDENSLDKDGDDSMDEENELIFCTRKSSKVFYNKVWTDNNHGDGTHNGFSFGRTKDYSNDYVNNNLKVLKLFSEVQKMQRQAIGLKDKLKSNLKIYNKQKKHLNRLKEIKESKEKLLKQKSKLRSALHLRLQDKLKEDSSDILLAMPTRQTDDLKNFVLSIYKYSPQAYIYMRNSLRTLLPSCDILDGWLKSGYRAKNVMPSSNLIKVTTEQTETELTCKLSIQ